MGRHERTIDWNEYWREDREADAEFPANVGSYGKADLLARFFEQVGTPADFTSVGCGPADCPIELAERFPEMDVYGYDAAESIVRRNRAKTQRENVSFEVAALPEFDAERQFDVVYCYATLHYVAEIERAIRNLYARVRPGGYLVFNYPNEETRTFYHEEFADEPAFRERFELVFEGENVVSADEIEGSLDAPVRDYWGLVDADAEDGAAAANPCVYVEK